MESLVANLSLMLIIGGLSFGLLGGITLISFPRIGVEPEIEINRPQPAGKAGAKNLAVQIGSLFLLIGAIIIAFRLF